MHQKQQDQLIEMLIHGDFTSSEQIKILLEESKETGESFEKLLLKKFIITDEHLGRLIAEMNNWKFINLRNEGVDDEIVQKIPEEMARSQKIIAFKEDPETVYIATLNPEETTLLHTLQKKLNKNIFPYYATEADIRGHLYLYKSDIKSEFKNLLEEEKKKTQKNNEDDDLVVRVVDMILTRGYDHGASDIHIEPFSEKSIIRFRIDGVMQDMLEAPKYLHEGIISRIKVLSKLRTDEHQVPQDGKIPFEIEDKKFDIRVSVVPTTKGENIVLRILAEKSSSFTLEDLHMNEKNLEQMRKAIKNPWGMILVTGPTGSGKTTTLYALLKILNTREVNIATIEDPVENNIDGISQIQVNNKAELTFASGLRSIVRQDPDIIMVGEIRDKETADIAVNSAMTGHLVLSTLHTNDAPTSVPRLLDMEVEPFLLSSTVNVVVAQRLVRKICPKCITSYEVSEKDLAQQLPQEYIKKLNLKKGKTLTLYKGKGCPLCGQTGYHGRMGVFEIMEMDDSLKKLVMEEADAETIKKQAIKNGMTTMFEDGYHKVINGLTTFEEVFRVIKE